MKYFNSIKFFGLLMFCSLGLLAQSCQRDTVEPESASPSPDELSSGAQSRPSIGQDPQESNDEPATPDVKEITYVAEKIDPVAAQLKSQYAGSKINVRSQPSTRSSIKHIGYKGDRVTLLRQADGEGGYLWYYLRFAQSQAEGWVRSDFVAQGNQNLKPRKAYRVYDFDADPWLASFNQSYQQAKASNEAWLSDPEQVAQRVAGFSNSGECEPDSVATVESPDPNWVTVVVESGEATSEQCAGDSVAASEVRVDLIRTGQVWEVDWAGGRYRCHQGRGQQDFAPTLCS